MISRRWTLALLCVVAFLNYLDRFLLGILLPAIKADLHLTDTELGFATGVVFALFFSLTAIPIGHLADRHSRKKIIGIAVALWSVMTVVCGLAQNFLQLALARLVLGIGEAGSTPPAHSLIADLFPMRERALALSLFSMGMPVGILFGFLGGGYAAQAWGWRIALVIFGLPGLLVAAIAVVFLPDPIRGADFADLSAIKLVPMRGALAVLVRSRSFVHVCLGSGSFAIVWLGFITWLPSYFSRSLHLSVRDAGTGLAFVLGTSQMLGLVAGGWLADRLGRRDSRWPFWTCALGALLPLPFFVAALLSSSPAVAMAMLFPAFFLAMLQGGPAAAIVQAVTGPGMRAVTVAVYFVVVNCISGFGSQLIGLFSDWLYPSLGRPALGASMLLVATVFCLWSAWNFVRGARFPASDATVTLTGQIVTT